MEALKPTYRDVARPFRAKVWADDPTASALMQMEQHGCAVLPVLEPGTDELLGVVFRAALNAECRGAGHLPAVCPVRNHVQTHFDFRREDERLPESGVQDVPDQEENPHVVVVNEVGVPVGHISAASAKRSGDGPTAQSAALPAIAPRR